MKTTILLATVSAFAALANKTIAETQVASSITDISLSPDGKILALHTPVPDRPTQQSGALHQVIVLTGKPKEVQEKLNALQSENRTIIPLALFPFSKPKKKADAEAESTGEGVLLILGQHQP